jgi:hypothetical protein
MAAPSAPLPLEHLQAAFLSILPRIELHGRITFRHLKCAHRQEEAVAEMVAFGWLWFRRLIEQGKDPLAFASRIADFAARHVKCGRRLCGQEKGKDVLSGLAQRRHGFAVESLPSTTRTGHEERYTAVHGQHKQDVWEERLRDNTQTPVPEQVAFRIDFPAWLVTLTGRERRVVREMARNERTLDLSKRFQVSPARISQLRRELHNDWTRFCGDDPT